MLSIGVDIGGTKVAAGVVTRSGEVIERLTLPSPTSSPASVEDLIVEIVGELRAGHMVSSVGIGAAGWVDSEQALVRFSPHLAWRNEPLRDRLRTRIDLPVIVDNDANAAAWAEYRFGAGRGAGVMVCITLGTGIGGALLVDGRVFRGTYGMAGEWGHMTVVPEGHWCACGNRGCWEQYASGNALVREANGLIQSGAPQAAALAAAAGPDGVSGPEVTTLALAGDRPSVELITDVGTWLGKGMANLAAALDPELFVIGGGLSEAGGLLLKPAIDAYARSLTGRGYRPIARIALAHFRNDAGLIGAADLARHAISEPPGLASAFWPWRRTSRGRTTRRRRLRDGFLAE
jgi:glucokinase